MTAGRPMPQNVIPFPRQLRVVPFEPLTMAQADLPQDEPIAMVDHDGRLYDLAALIRHLSPDELRQVGATAPRSGQELWDEVVRHWPALAAEIASAVGTCQEMR